MKRVRFSTRLLSLSTKIINFTKHTESQLILAHLQVWIRNIQNNVMYWSPANKIKIVL